MSQKHAFIGLLVTYDNIHSYCKNHPELYKITSTDRFIGHPTTSLCVSGGFMTLNKPPESDSDQGH